MLTGDWKNQVLDPAIRKRTLNDIRRLEAAGAITREQAGRCRHAIAAVLLAMRGVDSQRDQVFADFLKGSGILDDFAADVMQRLRPWKPTLHGCALDRVVPHLDGTIQVFFKGDRDNGIGGTFPWEGSVRINAVLLRDRKWMGDPVAVANLTLQVLEDIKRQGTQPLIHRAAQN